jgi:hypothetical protein
MAERLRRGRVDVAIMVTRERGGKWVRVGSEGERVTERYQRKGREGERESGIVGFKCEREIKLWGWTMAEIAWSLVW